MSSYPLNNTVNNSDSGGGGGGGGGGSSTSSSTTSATNNNNSGGNHHRLHWMNWPFGDTTFTKVFVGGLAWETQSHTLRRHFEQFGDILEAVVISDKNTGRSKGYGFVTFRDAESARRACGDPNPIIDGRRANCNLASLGGRSHHHHHHHHLPNPSPPPPLPFHYAGHLRSPAAAPPPPPPPPPFPFGSNSSSSRSPGPRSRGATTFNATPAAAYHQPLPYTYQPGFVYTPYGNSHYPYLAFRRFPSKEGPHQYGTYGSEYAHPQGPYTPYAVQQYVHLYGMPGMVNPGMNSRGQLGQTVPGFHGYTAVQSYGLPSHNVVQLGGPAYRTSTTTIPVIQAPHPSGIATPDPGQSQTTVSAHSPQFTSGSDQDSNR